MPGRGNCGVVDFTLPAVADWWGTYQQKPIDDGVSGFWTDMGEPARVTRSRRNAW